MKRALIIGINYIGTSNELFGCISDAYNVLQLIEDDLKYESTTLMMERDKNTDLHPTRSNILKQIAILVDGLVSGDEVFFHYSGHGTQYIDRNFDELDGFDECLVPLDCEDGAGLITDDELREILVDKIPKGVKLTGILDCCNSGSAFDLKYTLKPTITYMKKKVKRTDFKSFSDFFIHVLNHGFYTKIPYITTTLNISETVGETEGEVIMLSGCKDDQYSIDINDGELKGGALTLAFLAVMAENNNQMPCYKLLEAIRKRISEVYESSQIPQMTFGRWSNAENNFL